MAPVTTHTQDMLLQQKTEFQGAAVKHVCGSHARGDLECKCYAIEALEDLKALWVQQAPYTWIRLSYSFNSPYVSA